MMHQHTRNLQSIKKHDLQLLEPCKLLPDLVEANFLNDLAADLNGLVQSITRSVISLSLPDNLLLEELRRVLLAQRLDESSRFIRRTRRTNE